MTIMLHLVWGPDQADLSGPSQSTRQEPIVFPGMVLITKAWSEPCMTIALHVGSSPDRAALSSPSQSPRQEPIVFPNMVLMRKAR